MISLSRLTRMHGAAAADTASPVERQVPALGAVGVLMVRGLDKTPDRFIAVARLEIAIRIGERLCRHFRAGPAETAEYDELADTFRWTGQPVIQDQNNGTIPTALDSDLLKLFTWPMIDFKELPRFPKPN